MNEIIFKLGCFNAALSIIMASAGGHKPWEEKRKELYSKAFHQHIFSSFGMIISAFRFSYLAFALFGLGGSLFSGTLYYRCFSNNESYNKLLPIGGVFLICGWLSLALL